MVSLVIQRCYILSMKRGYLAISSHFILYMYMYKWTFILNVDLNHKSKKINLHLYGDLYLKSLSLMLIIFYLQLF